jgi:hypothetical protein
MKFLQIFLFLFIINTSYSQQIVLNEIDEFTKTKRIFSTTRKGKYWKGSDDSGKGGFNNLYISSRYINADSVEQLYLVFDVGVSTIQCFNNQSTVILKLDNEELITFKYIDNVECKNSSITGYFIFEGTIEEQKETLKKLSLQNILKVRVNFTQAYQDIEIITEKHEIIKEHFKLLLEEINKK